MNILFHQGALGDWVLTFPILRALGPTLAVAASSKAKLACDLIADVQPCDIEQPDCSLLHAADSGISPVWSNRLAGASLIISFVSDGRDAWADNVRRRAPQAKLAFIQPRPPKNVGDRRLHVCDWHDRQLRDQGIELAYSPINRTINPGGPVVVHPGSGGRDKCWPTDRFATLTHALTEQAKVVRILLGEVELATWPAAIVERWLTKYDARIVPTLDELRHNLAQAALFIGNDAGPTHLAAAMGVATIALFGPSSARIWAPRGPAVTVLAPTSPQPMDWLSCDAVLAACRSYV